MIYMKCSNCGFDLLADAKFCSNCGSDINKKVELNSNNLNNDIKVYKKNKIYSLISLLLALIPILLITCCYIYSNGDTSENGKDSIFWLVVIYFWTIGLPVAYMSVYLGVKSFKIKKNIFSILGIIIGALPIVILSIAKILPIFISLIGL